MEVYILDSLLRRTEVVDKFESFIWTERWQELGDVQIKLASTLHNRSLFTLGTRLAINESFRVMTVEAVLDDTDEEGKDILTVSGRSLEAILEDRPMFLDTVDGPSFVTNPSPPAEILRVFFNYICRPNAYFLDEKIPFITAPPSFYPEDTIPEYATDILWEQQPSSLLEPFLNISKSYDLGFRLVRFFDTSQLYFDVYTGQDRTTQQTLLDPVIFSPNLDNLQNTTELSTIQGSKNVAYVFSEAGMEVVFGEGVDPEVSGFDRRVLVVDANDIAADDVEASTKMIQRGEEELLQHRGTSIFEGEINQSGQHKYGVHYELGDLVEVRNKDGIITYKRVSEQIFVSDSEGERSYPTLAIDQFTGLNSWLSLNNDPIAWSELTTEVWADQ